MKKLLQKISLLVTVFGFGLVTALTPVAVYAQSSTSSTGPNIQQGLENGSCLNTQGGCDVGSGEESVNKIITTVINIFSLVVGVVSVIMIIIGGLKYITSGGDSNNVSGAKNTILYAIVGLVIVALAQIIVKFVLNRVTNPSGA